MCVVTVCKTLNSQNYLQSTFVYRKMLTQKTIQKPPRNPILSVCACACVRRPLDSTISCLKSKNKTECTLRKTRVCLVNISSFINIFLQTSAGSKCQTSQQQAPPGHWDHRGWALAHARGLGVQRRRTHGHLCGNLWGVSLHALPLDGLPLRCLALKVRIYSLAGSTRSLKLKTYRRYSGDQRVICT